MTHLPPSVLAAVLTAIEAERAALAAAWLRGVGF